MGSPVPRSFSGVAGGDGGSPRIILQRRDLDHCKRRRRRKTVNTEYCRNKPISFVTLNLFFSFFAIIKQGALRLITLINRNINYRGACSV